MHDLTRETRKWCSSNESWETDITGKNGKTYTVTYGRVNHGPYLYNYVCTCEAFKFGKGKPCKHIEEAKTRHCMFNHEAACGGGCDTTGLDVCPKCGLKMVSFSIMV